MPWLKRHYETISEALFLLIVFFVSQLPLRDFDIWFHLKSGEVFSKLGVIHYDPFSYTAGGREWIAHEWLFGYVAYLLQRTVGIWSVQALVSVFFILLLLSFLLILRYIFKVGFLTRLFLTFVLFVSVYEFNTARPHPIAYSFVALELFFILAFLKKQKKWLYCLPLVTLVWVNVHSSNFLSWGLIVSYIVVLFIQWLWKKDKLLLTQIKTLSILGIICAGVTLTPPMGIYSYKLVWQFYKDRDFLGKFIAEWSPTNDSDNLTGYYTLILMAVLAAGLFFFTVWKKKKIRENLWALPILFMGLMAFTAVRNVYLGTFALLLILGVGLKRVYPYVQKPLLYVIFIPFFVASGLFFGELLREKWEVVRSMRLYFPVDSTQFVKNNLTGNMFNDYTYGGYILYYTYPKLKVFIDGRADVYLCCEVHDYMLLATNKYLPDNKYRAFLKTYFDAYKIDFAIISTQKNNVMRKVSRLLNTDPQWSLVFWDDSSQVFVKRNGKNDTVIKQYGTSYATPYLQDPYIKGHEKEALTEYIIHDKLRKSAHTSNAIGLLIGGQGDLEGAKNRFEEAMRIDPTFESPYMNLAELAAHNGDIQSAIQLYAKAKELAPDRGLIYVRLGELYIEGTGDIASAKKIWEQGLKNTADDEKKNELRDLLKQIPAGQ